MTEPKDAGTPEQKPARSAKADAETPKHEPDAGAEAGSSHLLRDLVSIAIVVGILVGLVYAFIRDQLQMHHAETALIVDVKTTTGTMSDLCGPPTRDGRPIAISMLYSDDKKAWIEESASRFARLCPNIQVKLSSMGDIEAADAIVSGEVRPTLWAPADDLVLRYLSARWRHDHPSDKELFDIHAQTSIVQSPLVMLMWKDRVQVVQRILFARGSSALRSGFWVNLVCPQVPKDPSLDGVLMTDMVPGTWIDWYNPLIPPAPPKVKKITLAKPPEPEPEDLQPLYQASFPTLAEIKSWGRVKVVHTSPTRSTAGLGGLYIVAFDYMLPPALRSPEYNKEVKQALNDPKYRGRVLKSDSLEPDFTQELANKKEVFQRWLRRCEGGLESPPKSARELTSAFYDVGKTRYDAVITYEHLSFSVFKAIDRYAGTIPSVELAYPVPTLMTKHPVVTLREDERTHEELLSAEKWLNYLRSIAVQKRAVEYGFRPANPDVSIREHDVEGNPFLTYRRYNVKFDDVTVEPPRIDGESVFNLVRAWQDATGRN